MSPSNTGTPSAVTDTYTSLAEVFRDAGHELPSVAAAGSGSVSTGSVSTASISACSDSVSTGGSKSPPVARRAGCRPAVGCGDHVVTRPSAVVGATSGSVTASGSAWGRLGWHGDVVRERGHRGDDFGSRQLREPQALGTTENAMIAKLGANGRACSRVVHATPGAVRTSSAPRASSKEARSREGSRSRYIVIATTPLINQRREPSSSRLRGGEVVSVDPCRLGFFQRDAFMGASLLEVSPKLAIGGPMAP